ncbi:S8 family serine peptidase [Desulfovibrio sulfodismutans]|uniref:S8 family serine peptidase n=1 Tax=Desulfolutivibrio sulfodismutans TaxID=63561 RepID=A0A7K3NN55_9BACT|nr:S8 family serine peptidase [Desulfolutivibrio sulfodismutans]NDY57620.1 S8 family serine peptidase [Desulfolutivibrio sulfodismutans]QLA14068.1 S8 family serine peptidase [Desulfolutivibrio sulfodismutans DSM 3696]
MKRQHHIALVLVLSLLLLGASGAASAGDKSLRFTDVPAQALSADGKARVIVGVTVAKYADLAASAAQFKVVAPGEAKTGRQAAADTADAALAAAIAQGTDGVLSSLPAQSYTVTRTYSAFPFVAISVTQKALEALQADPRVTSIEIDAPIPVPVPVPDNGGAGSGKTKGGNTKDDSSQAAPPAAPSAKAANLNWGPPKVGADVAWTQGYTGAGWYVAILDTGIRRTHEFFSGKTIVEACYSVANNCPGNTSSAFGTGSAAHYASTYQSYDHGTHCAGIATGKKADGSVAGVAKDSNLIAIQVFSITGATSLGSYPSDQLAALNYVYSLRNSYSIAAASMSLGSGEYSSACDSDSRKAAIDLLRSVNIATTIATGNDEYCGYIGIPACISTSIAVGSSTSDDLESYFNNWHATLQTLFAPGTGIYSSTGGSDTSYESWNGTSMATPHVAGAWAILRQNRPNDSVSTILSRVLAGGVTMTTGCGTGETKPRLYIPGALLGGSTGAQGTNTLLLLGE